MSYCTVKRGQCCRRLYADSLAVGLAMQLVRRYSSLQDVHIGLAEWRHTSTKSLRIIDDHLNGEQEGRVPLRASS